MADRRADPGELAGRDRRRRRPSRRRTRRARRRRAGSPRRPRAPCPDSRSAASGLSVPRSTVSCPSAASSSSTPLAQLDAAVVEGDRDSHQDRYVTPRWKAPELWRELGQQLRVDSVRAAAVAKSGHPTSSMSAADLMAVLLAKYLRYDFDEPDDPAQRPPDLLQGPRLAAALLDATRRPARSPTRSCSPSASSAAACEGHPTPAIPWVDVATGSLGQGLPIGVGIALAGKQLDRLPYRVWVLCGDSEMAEGSMWEAFEHAGLLRARQPDRDRRRQPARPARRDDARLGPRRPTPTAREAFGWHAIEIDGHDVEAIDAAYARGGGDARAGPTVIVARTIKGKGVKAVEDKHELARQGARRSRGGDRGARRRCATSSSRSRSPRPPSRTASRSAGGRAADATSSARRSRRARPTATRSRRSARRAATSSRSTARSRTRPTPRSSRKAHPDRYFEMYIAEQQMVAAAVGCRCAAGSRSPRPSRRSSRAPTTSSGWPRSAGRTSASAARTPASRSARTGPRRWRSRTSPMFRAVHGSTVLYPCDANQTAQARRRDGRPRRDRLPAHDARGDAGRSTAPDEELPDRRQPRRCAPRRATTSTIVGAGITAARGAEGGRRARRARASRPA